MLFHLNNKSWHARNFLIIISVFICLNFNSSSIFVNTKDKFLKKFEQKHFDESYQGYKDVIDETHDCFEIQGVPQKGIIPTYKLCVLSSKQDDSFSHIIRVSNDTEAHISGVLEAAVHAYNAEESVLIDIGGHIGKHCLSVATLANRLNSMRDEFVSDFFKPTDVWCVEPFERNLVYAYKSAEMNNVTKNVHFLKNTIDYEREEAVVMLGGEGKSAGMTLTNDLTVLDVIRGLFDNDMLEERGVNSITIKDVIDDVLRYKEDKEVNNEDDEPITKSGEQGRDTKPHPIPIIMKLDIELMETRSVIGSLEAFVNPVRYHIPYMVMEWLYDVSPHINFMSHVNYSTKKYNKKLNINLIHVLNSLGYECYTEGAEKHWERVYWERMPSNIRHILYRANNNLIWKMKDARNILQVKSDCQCLFPKRTQYFNNLYI